MRKDRYIVGYKGAGNIVYGKRHLEVSNKKAAPAEDYAHPMTEHQAKRGLKKMPCTGAVIFELVPVDL